MKFVKNIEEKEYKDFFNKSKFSTILQTYEWGQFCIKGKNQTPYYVGVKNEKGKLLCTALLLKRKLPFNKCSFYAPRGYNIDFNNQELLSFFTKELIKFMKEEKAISITIDPEVMYQELDNSANVIPNGKNNFAIHEYLLKLGYKHAGFNKLYENEQPRYTFIIDLNDDYQSKMNKTFLKNTRKAIKYGVEFYVGNESDLVHFNELYKKTAERDDFTGYSDEYYINFYKIFKKNNMTDIFLCKIFPNKVIEVIEKDLDEVNNDLKKDPNNEVAKKRQENMLTDIAFYSQFKKEQEIIVSAHIMAYYQDKVVALYAGSDRDFYLTCANSYIYTEKFDYVKEQGYKSVDLFGVAGDPNTKHKNLAGIYEFKRKLGADLIEFIGQYDLIGNKFYYNFFKFTIPVYRKLKSIIKK